MGSVVKPWMSNLSLRMQTVILCTLRGCDGMPREDVSKQVIRHLRSVVLIHGSPPGVPSTFMDPTGVVETFEELTDRMFGDVDKYPIHFLMHFLHSTEIIGLHHPDKDVADRWYKVYLAGVHKLHLSPESSEGLEARLGDGGG